VFAKPIRHETTKETNNRAEKKRANQRRQVKGFSQYFAAAKKPLLRTGALS
jgi:hypothetical protein